MELNTTGFTSLKPGSGKAQGFPLSVTVSPTRTSLTLLMPAMQYPTSPALNSADGIELILK